MGSITTPFAASGPREPTQRPRQIPPAVRGAVLKMIYDGCDLVVAAQASGLRPDTMRRWLHRPELVGFLRKERAAFRQALCAGNERALAQIRDESDNAMAKVNSIKCLEDMNEESSLRRSSDMPSPGVTIRILNMSSSPAPIDITPRLSQIIDAEQ
jgi:hypothetical protein